MVLKITNRQARTLLLETYGLNSPLSQKPPTREIIDQLGFLQLDAIRAVARAHHHIIWTRNQTYRESGPEKNVWNLLSDRALFEHFTHDASLLPTEFYPVWQKQFRRFKTGLSRKKHWQIETTLLRHVKDRIRKEGPLSTHAFNTKVKDKSVMWARPPHKRALDYLWYSGDLTTSHRENFTKFYDLTERVIPENLREEKLSDTQQIDRLCEMALSRLVFAREAEIKAFWDVCNRSEISAWRARAGLVNVEVESHDGTWLPALVLPGIETRLSQLSEPSQRLRVLNPFDPLTRDRKRLSRLFGFEYKIEIFVPASKRKWGYYVYPILEGTRFVGRIEIKADRKADKGAGRLNVLNFWPETGVKWGAGRRSKLEAELNRMARFAGVKTIIWL